MHTFRPVATSLHRTQCPTCTCGPWTGGNNLVLSGLTASCNQYYNGLWTESGLTADTRPWYTHTYTTTAGADKVEYMYYDRHCAGKGISPSKWMIDSDKPNTTARSDLDGDGGCTFFAYMSTIAFTPPSGDWNVFCNNDFTAFPLPLTFQPTPVGACDPSASGKDEASGWCVCAKGLFCANGGTVGDVCDSTAPRDRWNPDKVSVAARVTM
jgi:hypothetical protein